MPPAKTVICLPKPQDLSHMSPYITEQIKRFGEYVLDLAHRPANLHATRDKFLFKAKNEELKAAA